MVNIIIIALPLDFFNILYWMHFICDIKCVVVEIYFILGIHRLPDNLGRGKTLITSQP